jgi:hypothetical protein
MEDSTGIDGFLARTLKSYVAQELPDSRERRRQFDNGT